MPLIDTPANYTMINGVVPSSCDINVTMVGTPGSIMPMSGIKSISTSSSLTEGFQLSGGRPIARTKGIVAYEASWEVYRTDYQAMLRSLIAGAPRRTDGTVQLSLAFFVVNVLFTPPGATEIYNTILKGCRVTGRELSSTEGPDADVVSCTLSPLEIVDMIDGQPVAPI